MLLKLYIICSQLREKTPHWSVSVRNGFGLLWHCAVNIGLRGKRLGLNFQTSHWNLRTWRQCWLPGVLMFSRIKWINITCPLLASQNPSETGVKITLKVASPTMKWERKSQWNAFYGEVVHALSSSILEAEAGGWGVQSQSIYAEFEASQGYKRPKHRPKTVMRNTLYISILIICHGSLSYSWILFFRY